MHPRGPDESQLGAAEHRPPSARSRESLVEGLRQQVADARARLEEAGLRAETHRLLGNHDAAVDATREQQDILADVEERLGRVVSSAVVQRDAEQVLADATDLPDDVPVHAPGSQELRARTPMLAGLASVLAVVAVSTAAVLGVSRGLGSVEVAGAAGDREAQEQTPSSSPGSSDAPLMRPSTPLVGTPHGATSDGATADGANPATPSEAVAAPDVARPTSTEPAAGETDVADESDDGDSELDEAVTELLDAVGGLDEDPDADPEDDPSESDGEEPTIDDDISGQERADLRDDVAGDAPDHGTQDGGRDGFVLAPSAQ